MSDHSEHCGLAALSICEALLLALKDGAILPESEIVGILRDAAVTHENAATVAESQSEKELHEAAAILIFGIIAGRSQIRHSGASELQLEGKSTPAEGRPDMTR